MSRLALFAPRPSDGAVGGAERLWSALVADLHDRGHEVDLITHPFPEENLSEVLAGYAHFASVDASDYDLVISGKYPAWMVDHPNHVVYLLHPLRGLYDTYPASLPTDLAIPLADDLAGLVARNAPPAEIIGWAQLQLRDQPWLDGHPGPFGRAVVHALDRLAFDRVTRFGAISETVASRPGYLPIGEPVMVAHPESSVATGARRRPLLVPSGPTVFFTASRLDHPKRIDLAIAAFAEFGDLHARFLIAGEGPAAGHLHDAAAGDRRVAFLGRIDDDELVDHYRNATAVVFCPADEDYGYITAEAMAAGTPVITTSDAGGPTELVEHGVNGLVMEPDPKRLAWGMAHIADSPHTRWSMGLNARRRAAAVSWRPLLDEIDRLLDRRPRPKVVTLSTYPIEPMIGGGPRRIRNLHRRLARSADVTVLVSSTDEELAADDGHPRGRTRRRLIEPGLVQVEVPRSPAQRAAEDDIYAVVGFPVDDLTVAALAPSTPAWGEELSAQVTDADIVITSHPFLAPTLETACNEPAWTEVHDSHNHETVFKASALRPDDRSLGRRRRWGARWLAGQAEWAETIAARRAHLITTCTADDLAALQLMAPGTAGLITPNGVDASALPLRTAEQQARARQELLGLAGLEPDDPRPIAVFIGSWHPPNIDAGRLVLDMARLRPDWVFLLAGSHTSEFAEDDHLVPPDNVGMLAVFDEGLLWPLLAGASVALNPMASGGGSNLKLFDYLAVGAPVLTTPIGARGLDDAERYVAVCQPTVDALCARLDTILDDRATPERIAAGRRLVEEIFDWRVLGDRWAAGILGAAGLVPEPTDSRPAPVFEPVLADEPPPPLDPVLAAVRAIGHAARTRPPTPEETTMDPVVRERLKQASDNRHVGRLLPDTARMRLPKQALIRVGQVISNEQLNYNEAILDVVTRLAATVEELSETVRRLEDQLADRDDTARDDTARDDTAQDRP